MTASMIPTTRLARVELRKMFTTRSGFWLLVSIAVLTPVAAGSVVVKWTRWPRRACPTVPTPWAPSTST